MYKKHPFLNRRRAYGPCTQRPSPGSISGIGPWISLSALALVHCKGETASAPPPPLVQVEVADVIQKDVPIQMEWVGTTDGSNNALIRAQVSGYLLKRPYTEGAFVKKGDLLFQLDPSKFQTALDQALGDLAKAQAQLRKASRTSIAIRLLPRKAPSAKRSWMIPFSPMRRQKGLLPRRKPPSNRRNSILDGQESRLPIDGVVGISKAQIGDLIDANTELTSMSTLDPIRVYFPMSEQEYSRSGRQGAARL